MNPAAATNAARWLALGAGSLDAATGAGLVLAPASVLPLMLVPVPGAEALVFVRFTGVFVGAVGASCLWGLLDWRRSGSPAFLRGVLRVTILFRLAAGAFTAAAVARGWLGAAWLSVTATDWTLAALQGWLLAKGACREA